MMTKYLYDQLDFYFTVQDDIADDDLIIAGYAIRSEDKGAFLLTSRPLSRSTLERVMRSFWTWMRVMHRLTRP